MGSNLGLLLVTELAACSRETAQVHFYLLCEQAIESRENREVFRKRMLHLRGGRALEQLVELQNVDLGVLRFLHPMGSQDVAGKRIQLVIALDGSDVMLLGHQLEVKCREHHRQRRVAEDYVGDLDSAA